MKILVEFDLDEHEVQVLRDISLTPKPVKPMSGAWRSKAEKLQIYSLVTIEAIGTYEKYSLTPQGEAALSQVG